MAIWVVVADAGRARVFQAESLRGELTEVMDKADPLARVARTELASDEPGRQQSPGGRGLHGMQDKVSPREAEDERFARELVADVQGALDANRIERFYLMAPPRFLGLLRKVAPDRVTNALAGDLDKDLTTHSVEDIRSHMAELA